MDNLLQYTYNEPGQIKRLKVDALNEYPLLTNKWNSKSSVSITDWLTEHSIDTNNDDNPIGILPPSLENLEDEGYTVFDPVIPPFIDNPELTPPNAPVYPLPPNFTDGCDKIKAYIDEYYTNKGETTPEFPSEEALRYMADKIRHDDSAILGVDYIYPTIDVPGYVNSIPICAEAKATSYLAFRASSGSSRVYQCISVINEFRKASKSNFSYAKAITLAKSHGGNLEGIGAVREYMETSFSFSCTGSDTSDGGFNKVTFKKSYSIPLFSNGTVTLESSVVNCEYPAGCSHDDDTRKDIYVEGIQDTLTHYVENTSGKTCIFPSGWTYKLWGNTLSNIEYIMNNITKGCPLSKRVYLANGVITLTRPIANSVIIVRANSDIIRGSVEISGEHFYMDDTFEVIDEYHISIPDTTGTFTLIYAGGNNEIPGCHENTKVSLCNFQVCRGNDAVIIVVKPGKLPGVDADTPVTNMDYETGDVAIKVKGNTIAGSGDLFYSNATDRGSIKQHIVDNISAIEDDIVVSGHTEYDYDVPGTRYHVSEFYSLNKTLTTECGGSTIMVLALSTELSIRHKEDL